MYHVSAQGVDERMITVHYYYYVHKKSVILSIIITRILQLQMLKQKICDVSNFVHWHDSHPTSNCLTWNIATSFYVCCFFRSVVMGLCHHTKKNKKKKKTIRAQKNTCGVSIIIVVLSCVIIMWHFDKAARFDFWLECKTPKRVQVIISVRLSSWLAITYCKIGWQIHTECGDLDLISRSQMCQNHKLLIVFLQIFVWSTFYCCMVVLRSCIVYCVWLVYI